MNVGERPPARGPAPRYSGRAGVLLIAGIVLASATMRAPITSVGPLVGEIRTDTGMSAAAAGLLTTLPVLAFAAISPLAPVLSRRLGIELVLVGSTVALTVGILLRWAPSVAPLFAGTLVIGAAIALANVLLPALVKREFLARQGMMTAVYSTVLAGAAGIGSGVAIPLANDVGLGWQGALAVWAVPAALAAVIWLRRLQRRPARAPTGVPELAVRGLWRSRLAWQVTVFWGMQSLGFYTTVAWLPEILIDHGIDPGRAGLLLLVSQFAGLAVTLTVPTLADRHPDQRTIVFGGTLLLAAGIVGLIAAGETAALLWVILLGLGQGAGLSVALMLLVLRSRDHRAAAELSGMAQTIGYLIAAAGPVGAGALHDATGGWTPILLVMLGVAFAQLLFGLGAARDVVVEDQYPETASR